MKKSPKIQNGVLPVKKWGCAFYHMTIWVLESTACHLQIVCKGSLRCNQLTFTVFSLLLLECIVGIETDKSERVGE